MLSLLLAAHAAAGPVDVEVRIGAATAIALSAPNRLGVGLIVPRGPFWIEAGATVGMAGDPSGLDLVLLDIANLGDPSSDFVRIVTFDPWGFQVGGGVGNPERVARRPVGSPFLWAGVEVRGVRRTEIVYAEATGYAERGAEALVEVGPLGRAGVVVAVGERVGVRLALEDRPRPDPNRPSGGWGHDTSLALDLSWRV